MQAQVSDWWRTVPPVTRWLFAGSMGLTLAANFGLLSPMSLIWLPTETFTSFQLWRVVTPFLYHGRLGFPFLMQMMFLYQYSSRLETGHFGGVTGDYVFFLLVVSPLLLLLATLLELPVLGPGLIMAILYYWSRREPNQDMTFWFGLRFKSIYFPFVLCGFTLLLGGFPLMELLGCLTGHLYHFLLDIYPQTYGAVLLRPPAFLHRFFGPGHAPPRPGQPQQGQQGRAQPNRFQAFGGGGQRLGND